MLTIIFLFEDSAEATFDLGKKWHLLLATGETSGDSLEFYSSKTSSADLVDLKSTREVAAGLDSKLFIQVLLGKISESYLGIRIPDFYIILCYISGSWNTDGYSMDLFSSNWNAYR